MSQKEGMGNREYKDSTFRKLYHDKNRASELYNGLTGRTASPDEIELSFVGGVLTRKLNHDVAFQVGQRMIVVLEHQSTPNENTPVRMLIYVAKIYERYLKKQVGRAIYGRQRADLPFPDFFLLYYGEPDDPEGWEMRLSDAFALGDSKLELVVTVFNINYERKGELLKKCPTLHGYSTLVHQVEKLRPSLGLD